MKIIDVQPVVFLPEKEGDVPMLLEYRPHMLEFVPGQLEPGIDPTHAWALIWKGRIAANKFCPTELVCQSLVDITLAN